MTYVEFNRQKRLLRNHKNEVKFAEQLFFVIVASLS